MDFDTQAEIKNLDYAQIWFRTIDRIQSLSSKDYQDENSKLFDFSWSVRMFMQSIPTKNRDDEFKKDVIAWELILKNKKTFNEKFDHYLLLFSHCIDLLARRGYLYKNVKNGSF